MKEILKNARFKTTLASILGALVVYALSKGMIDWATANLISSILVALGFSVNVVTNKK